MMPLRRDKAMVANPTPLRSGPWGSCSASCSSAGLAVSRLPAVPFRRAAKQHVASAPSDDLGGALLPHALEVLLEGDPDLRPGPAKEGREARALLADVARFAPPVEQDAGSVPDPDQHDPLARSDFDGGPARQIAQRCAKVGVVTGQESQGIVLLEAMEGHILGTAELMGTYQR